MDWHSSNSFSNSSAASPCLQRPRITHATHLGLCCGGGDSYSASFCPACCESWPAVCAHTHPHTASGQQTGRQQTGRLKSGPPAPWPSLRPSCTWGRPHGEACPAEGREWKAKCSAALLHPSRHALTGPASSRTSVRGSRAAAGTAVERHGFNAALKRWSTLSNLPACRLCGCAMGLSLGTVVTHPV